MGSFSDFFNMFFGGDQSSSAFGGFNGFTDSKFSSYSNRNDKKFETSVNLYKKQAFSLDEEEMYVSYKQFS